MLQTDPLPTTLGADLRALRKARGLTLSAVALALGRSVGWMSQVERDLSQPSIDELRELARLFDVPLSIFFGEAQAPTAERGRIVRAAGRRSIGSAEGLSEALLSPDLTGAFEVVHSVFAAGAASTETVERPTEELGVLTTGRLDLTIGKETYDIGPGDSFRIRGEPYSWVNPHAQDATALWVIAPPVY